MSRVDPPISQKIPANRMTQFKSDFLRILQERGYIHQCSDPEGLDALALEGPITGYIGFDCTATSLHAGSLLPIMILYWMQQTGHKPIALMGGGTTKVGDPSGKDESRKLLSDDQIQTNMDGIKKVFAKYLTFGDGTTDAIMVNNDDWLKDLNYISFLRDYGPHFTINRMLSFDSVKLRLDREQPLTFLEFNYMILQAYDYLELNRRHGCILQMGGSDQWGNIVNGMELTRRVAGNQAYALTSPLLTTSSGAKMGKSASGAVWLNGDMLSPYEFWQYFRNTEDADVGRFLRLFTTMRLNEVARLETLQGAELNEAKKILATEITAMVHSRDDAQHAEETARQAFEHGAAAEGLPTFTIDVSANPGILTALVAAGLAGSNGEARRHIKGGAIKLNDAPVNDEKRTLSDADLNADGVIKLSFGKKKHALLQPA